MVAAERGHVQVNATIVVVVANRGAHAVLGRLDPAGICYIRESHGAAAVRSKLEIVSVETSTFRDVSASGATATVDASALNEKDVEVAVVVIVQKGNAGRDDLRVVELPRHAVHVNEIEMSLGGRVSKPLGRRRGRARRATRAVKSFGLPGRRSGTHTSSTARVPAGFGVSCSLLRGDDTPTRVCDASNRLPFMSCSVNGVAQHNASWR